jgi:preprotein translocase subunit SecB
MSDQPQAAPQANQPVFNIEKIYIKDLSLENPGAPRSFLNQQAPQIDVSLQTRGEAVDNGLFEAVLTLTVTAKLGDSTLFLVEAAQAGLFTIRNVPESDVQPLLGIHCPTILFPYARETIADAITRAGFPPIHLAPINFEAIYQQQLQHQQQASPIAPAH